MLRNLSIKGNPRIYPSSIGTSSWDNNRIQKPVRICSFFTCFSFEGPLEEEAEACSWARGDANGDHCKPREEGIVERDLPKRSAPTLLPNKTPWRAHPLWCHNLPITNLPNPVNNNLSFNNKQVPLRPHLYPHLPSPPSPLQNSSPKPVSIRSETLLPHYRQTNPAKNQV